MKEDAEKKPDRSHVIRELEDRLLKKWKADKLHKELLLSREQPANVKEDKKFFKK